MTNTVETLENDTINEKISCAYQVEAGEHEPNESAVTFATPPPREPIDQDMIQEKVKTSHHHHKDNFFTTKQLNWEPLPPSSRSLIYCATSEKLSAKEIFDNFFKAFQVDKMHQKATTNGPKKEIKMDDIDDGCFLPTFPPRTNVTVSDKTREKGVHIEMQD